MHAAGCCCSVYWCCALNMRSMLCSGLLLRAACCRLVMRAACCALPAGCCCVLRALGCCCMRAWLLLHACLAAFCGWVCWGALRVVVGVAGLADPLAACPWLLESLNGRFMLSHPLSDCLPG
jgi:hypothetical protein